MQVAVTRQTSWNGNVIARLDSVGTTSGRRMRSNVVPRGDSLDYLEFLGLPRPPFALGSPIFRPQQVGKGAYVC